MRRIAIIALTVAALGCLRYIALSSVFVAGPKTGDALLAARWDFDWDEGVRITGSHGAHLEPDAVTLQPGGWISLRFDTESRRPERLDWQYRGSLLDFQLREADGAWHPLFRSPPTRELSAVGFGLDAQHRVLGVAQGFIEIKVSSSTNGQGTVLNACILSAPLKGAAPVDGSPFESPNVALALAALGLWVALIGFLYARRLRKRREQIAARSSDQPGATAP